MKALLASFSADNAAPVAGVPLASAYAEQIK